MDGHGNILFAHLIEEAILQIDCSVRGFDNFTVVLDVMGKQQMVYKHAISTITPAHPIAGMFGAEHPEKKPENA